MEKPNSPLVRQTIAYNLEASGTVDLGAASGPAAAPSVAGTYTQSSGWVGNYGIFKLQADGKIVTSNGQSGNWELFDADSRTYVLTLSQDRRSLVFQPGRGFIDPQNGNLGLEARR